MEEINLRDLSKQDIIKNYTTILGDIKNITRNVFYDCLVITPITGLASYQGWEMSHMVKYDGTILDATCPDEKKGQYVIEKKQD